MPKDNSAEAQKLKAEAAAAAEAAGKPKPGDEQSPKQNSEEKKSDPKPAAEAPKEQKPADKTVEKTPEQIEEERKRSEAAGLDSVIGAKKKELENLRLEKRTLGGQTPPPAIKTKPAEASAEAGEDDDESDEEDETDGEAPVETPPSPNPADEDLKADVAALKKREQARQAKLEKDVLTTFSKNDQFPLTNVSRDANNANWSKLLKYLPADYDRTSPESIQDALEGAYYAAFRKEIQAELVEKGKQQGLAEAVHVDNANMGGVVPGDKAEPAVELTDLEKTIAKKSGISEADYAASKAKMQG